MIRRLCVIFVALLLVCGQLLLTGCENTAEDETTVPTTTAAPEEETTIEVTTAKETTFPPVTTAAPVETTKTETTTTQPETTAAPSVQAVPVEAIGSKDAGKVSASYTPTGTPISALTAITDFAGSYYLTADIASNATTIESFTGTLDGNGHKITTTVPVFGTLSGNVKNLTVSGNITANESSGALSKTLGDAKIENVLVNAALSCDNTVVGVYVGGFAGTGAATGDVYFTNCEYGGILTNTYNSAGNNHKTGGFIGLTNSGTYHFENCTNSGDLTATSHVAGIVGEIGAGSKTYFECCLNTGSLNNLLEGQAGGLAGYGANLATAAITVEFVNCRNTGTITSVGACAAGIMARSGSSHMDTVVSFLYCTNEGTITSKGIPSGIVGQLAFMSTISDCSNTAPITCTGDNYAGGIIGYTSNYIEIYRCWNTGDVTADASGKNIGGILGNCNANGVLIEDCYNTGNVKMGFETATAARAGGIVGSAKGISEVNRCYNTGKVSVLTATAGQPAGGIVGYYSEIGSEINYCFNLGDVSSTAGFAGGILGYINALDFTISYCYNAGLISAGTAAAEISMSFAAANPTNLIDNFYLMRNNSQKAYICSGGTSYDTCETFTEAQMKDGSLVAKLNTASGKTCYVQVDGHPGFAS